MFPLENHDPIKEVFLRYSRIVFVGCSRTEGKPSHDIPRLMKEHGFEVACVNPHAESILGSPTFGDILEVPEEFLEILVVFRPPEEVPRLVDKILKSGKVPRVFWMQEGIRSPYAREKLEPLGVFVVEDRCIWKAYASLFVERDEVYERILRFARVYARAKGFVLNPDPQKLDEVIAALAFNEKTYGFRYCPCRVITGDFEEDKKKICPCYWHEEEIREMGHCRCGLFWDPKRVRAPGGIRTRDLPLTRRALRRAELPGPV